MIVYALHFKPNYKDLKQSARFPRGSYTDEVYTRVKITSITAL